MTLRRASAALRLRLAREEGFTMLATLGVLAVTTLLTGALFIGIQGDVPLGQHDLDGKRAYAAAEAGLNAYLYQLNQNPNYWQSCSNDSLSQTQVPGTSPATYYSYAVIPANGNIACTTNPIASLVDTATGSIRMKFIGYSGPGSRQVQRGIVASFRKATPLDFVWYTVYEALDSSISGYTDCGVFYRAGRASHCNISWITGDTISGPMYTQDQYLVNGSPTFGRGASDKVESLAPGTKAADVCSASNCDQATFNGTRVWSADFVPLPNDNAQLYTDAQNYGATFSGTTTITLSGTSATVVNCPTSTCTTSTVDLTRKPIIYVSNTSSCSPPPYDPQVNGYATSGCTGDVYVSGNYTTSATIAAANNVIINGNLTTSEDGSGAPTGGAALGVVANQFVRVMHGVTDGSGSQPCNEANVSGQTLANVRIDAAILALKHSFIVDNYDCGPALGTLTVNGSLVQNFRGAVGTFSGSSVYTGYLKSYTYDNRLAILLPPYLFDISTAGWHVVRETLCVPGGTNPATAC
jgi:hypothetical protein